MIKDKKTKKQKWCDHEKHPYPDKKNKNDNPALCLLQNCKRKEELVPIVELCTGLSNIPATNALLIQYTLKDNTGEKGKIYDMPFKLFSERPGL